MTVKVKKVEREEGEEGEDIVKAILEKDGKEHIYTAKLVHVLDEDIFKNLLHTWDKMIEEKEARAKLKKEDIEAILNERRGIEV